MNSSLYSELEEEKLPKMFEQMRKKSWVEAHLLGLAHI